MHRVSYNRHLLYAYAYIDRCTCMMYKNLLEYLLFIQLNTRIYFMYLVHACMDVVCVICILRCVGMWERNLALFTPVWSRHLSLCYRGMMTASFQTPVWLFTVFLSMEDLNDAFRKVLSWMDKYSTRKIKHNNETQTYMNICVTIALYASTIHSMTYSFLSLDPRISERKAESCREKTNHDLIIARTSQAWPYRLLFRIWGPVS